MQCFKSQNEYLELTPLVMKMYWYIPRVQRLNVLLVAGMLIHVDVL